MGFGFGVWLLRIWGLGFVAQDLGLRVCSLGLSCRAWVLGPLQVRSLERFLCEES